MLYRPVRGGRSFGRGQVSFRQKQKPQLCGQIEPDSDLLGHGALLFAGAEEDDSTHQDDADE